jgi:phospholipid transport system substrate-binding protein
MRTSYRRDLTLPRPAPKTKRGIVLALMAAGAFALGASFFSAPAAASPETEAFVQQTVDEGYEILNSDSAERSTQFRDFLLSLTDMRRIATFTLGQYVNRASEAEVSDFVDAFTDFATTVYEVRLGQYTGQTMRVVSSNDRAADDSVVNAVVVNPAQPNAAQINTAFRVRTNADGGLIITDMQVEGVWLAINQRADFTSFLQQNNGSVPALSASLLQQAQQLRQ